MPLGKISMHAISEWGIVYKNMLIARYHALIIYMNMDLCSHMNLFTKKIFHP